MTFGVQTFGLSFPVASSAVSQIEASLLVEPVAVPGAVQIPAAALLMTTELNTTSQENRVTRP